MNIIQPWETRKSCHWWQHGWTFRVFSYWRKSGRERQIVNDLTHMWNRKKPNTQKQSVEWWLLGAWWERSGRGKGMMLIKGYRLPVIRWINSGDQMDSMLITVNDSISYPWILLRKEISNVLTTKKKWQLCEVMEVLAITMVEIVVQYLSASIQHTVHLKLTQYYVSIISE